MSTIVRAVGYRLMEAGKPLAPADLELEAGPDDVIVEIAGCGVCHTDIGFATGAVPTRHPLPLVLGHEISGRVIATGTRAAEWEGRNVIVPAVIPCGVCPACLAQRPAVCRRQFMPGNDGDGGFATHVKVPARGLCPVPDTLPEGLSLADLSVVADAVTTPYEAIRLSGLGPDDIAVFVGVGGVGGFGVQIAAAMGSSVVAIDVDPSRLELASAHGASFVVDASETDPKQIKTAVRSFAKQSGRRGIGLKVFETSGTPAGQVTAFNLVDFGGYLAVVGFTPEKVSVRLSNLMALDATARGNWGCPPERYPEALALALESRIAVGPYVERHPLKKAAEIVEAVKTHSIKLRPVLVPDAD